MCFTLVPWLLRQPHSFNISQLPGEYTAQAAMRSEGFLEHNINSTHTGPIYTPGWTEAIIVKYRVKDTRVTPGIRTTHPMTCPPELEVDALNHWTMTPYKL